MEILKSTSCILFATYHEKYRSKYVPYALSILYQIISAHGIFKIAVLRNT